MNFQNINLNDFLNIEIENKKIFLTKVKKRYGYNFSVFKDLTSDFKNEKSVKILLGDLKEWIKNIDNDNFENAFKIVENIPNSNFKLSFLFTIQDIISKNTRQKISTLNDYFKEKFSNYVYDFIKKEYFKGNVSVNKLFYSATPDSFKKS